MLGENADPIGPPPRHFPVIARHRVAYYDEINEASRSLDWTNWAAFFIPVLTEAIEGFVAAVKFIAAKRAYLAKYESAFSERAKKVILRMFEDGEEGVKAGLSASKWVRMAKVSKPTARARARSRRVRRGGPPARRRFDKVNASPSPGRVGDRRNCYLNQSAIQHLPLTT